MSVPRPLIFNPIPNKIKRVDILQALLVRLVQGKSSRTLIFGLPTGYGHQDGPVAVAAVHYTDEESLDLASRCFPYGVCLIGIAEFDDEDEAQDVYAALDNVPHSFLLKVNTEERTIQCSTGLDYLTSVSLNVVTHEDFWHKQVTTFRLVGELLVSTLLETPDLKVCFGNASRMIKDQAAYGFPGSEVMVIPPEGEFLSSEGFEGKLSPEGKVEDTVKLIKPDVNSKDKEKPVCYTPPVSVIKTKILFDQSRCSFEKHPLMMVFEKSATCKYFEHYLGLDLLVVLPNNTLNKNLYDHFTLATCCQLEFGFRACIDQQLINSIAAERPSVHHFWPQFGQHFVSVVYPDNMCLEKTRDTRLDLHKLFAIKETRPYFRQSAALYQNLVGLISPHVSLKGKYSETECLKGHYEYRHYMQEGFNDDGWGCAYRSLQSIVSWFRLQGFTSREVPSHREIQQCLVSLGDKPASFVGSKQWIGSTEVSFVLEALLGVSCRIMSLSSGAEMASRASELASHFKIHGTPIMIGGGVLAHTIIGVSCDAYAEEDVSFLVLDPHFTGKDDLKTILSKGWVGWKDNNFWSKKDFYNLCMPLIPSSI